MHKNFLCTLGWDYLYAVTLKTKVFGDYNHARLEVSWITSTRGLLLRGYTGLAIGRSKTRQKELGVFQLFLYVQRCILQSRRQLVQPDWSTRWSWHTVGGDLAESIQRSASDRLGDLVPSQVRARTLQLQGFCAAWCFYGVWVLCLENFFRLMQLPRLRWTFLCIQPRLRARNLARPRTGTWPTRVEALKPLHVVWKAVLPACVCLSDAQPSWF